MTIEGRDLVETAWLAEHLGDGNLAVIDGSWHLPTENRNPRAEYLKERIPGAIFFDIDAISDTSSPLPHMLPSPQAFAAAVGALGVGDRMRVVAYDSVGMFSAARVWWTFRAMGLESVAVLDGGLPKWKAEGRPLEHGPPAERQPRSFTTQLDEDLVRDRSDVLGIVERGGAQVIDARSAGRFEGGAPEPRPGLRSGHIPGSLNIPYGVLLNKDGTFKSPGQLKAIFQAAGVEPDQPAVTSCGSGVTASIVSLALALVGQPRSAVYDGSWSEWGADASLPIETGPAKRP